MPLPRVGTRLLASCAFQTKHMLLVPYDLSALTEVVEPPGKWPRRQMQRVSCKLFPFGSDVLVLCDLHENVTPRHAYRFLGSNWCVVLVEMFEHVRRCYQVEMVVLEREFGSRRLNDIPPKLTCLRDRDR